MNKQFGILLLVTILAVGGGVWLTFNSQTKGTVEEKLFAPGMSQADKITQITLKNSQKNLLQASLVEAKWMASLPDVYGSYPIDKSKLADFLQQLVQAKLVEAKTTKLHNYHHLGVESIDNVDSLATLVSITMANSTKQWQVLVGTKANMGDGSYIRLPTSSQSWLIDRVIDVPNDEYEWLQRPLLPFKSSDISSISRSDSKLWTITKTEAEEFVLGTLPKNRSLRYPGVVNAYVDSLVNLDFEQVLPLDSEHWKQAKVSANLSVELSQNKSLQVQIANLENDYYLQFNSQTADGYYLDWTYKISTFSAQQLLKSKEDFLADIPEAGETKEARSTVLEGDAPD